MWNVGQVLRDTKDNELVVYLGLDMSKKDFKMVFKKGRNIITDIDDPSSRLTHIIGKDGDITLGKYVREYDLEGCYFGVIKPQYWEKIEPLESRERKPEPPNKKENSLAFIIGPC